MNNAISIMSVIFVNYSRDPCKLLMLAIYFIALKIYDSRPFAPLF